MVHGEPSSESRANTLVQFSFNLVKMCMQLAKCKTNTNFAFSGSIDLKSVMSRHANSSNDSTAQVQQLRVSFKYFTAKAAGEQ